MSDYTTVWEALQTSHVLLLVDTHSDPNKEDGYDMEFFDSKAEDIFYWFESIVKDKVSPVDLLMVNNAWLFIRPLVPAPAMPTKPNMKIMVLR